MEDYYGFVCDSVVDAIRIACDGSATGTWSIRIQCSEMRITNNEVNAVLDCVTDS